jgi:hypothetical protein
VVPITNIRMDIQGDIQPLEPLLCFNSHYL